MTKPITENTNQNFYKKKKKITNPLLKSQNKTQNPLLKTKIKNFYKIRSCPMYGDDNYLAV